MKFKLDFSIETAEERMEAIREIDLEKLSPKELETISNYVLYGKDGDGTSCVDRKEVQISTKFKSYKKNKTVSLDEMMENPLFDEGSLERQNYLYKKSKPVIDREKVKNIRGMKELWDQIDYYQDMLDQNQGKKPFKEGTRRLSQREIYYYTHFLIELRTQQYYLMDSEFPIISLQHNFGSGFYHVDPTDMQMNYPVLPRGVIRFKNDKEFAWPHIYKESYRDTKIYSEKEIIEMEAGGRKFFNFLNDRHIYWLVQYYEDIRLMTEKQPTSPLRQLLDTLDFYIDKADLNEQQKLIVRDKKLRVPNKEITEHLMEELGIYHQENYVSTIWNKIVKLIADAAELNYDEFLARNYDKAWKVCNKCGKELYRDSRNFVKKEKALDGFTSRCKKCDRALRRGEKIG